MKMSEEVLKMRGGIHAIAQLATFTKKAIVYFKSHCEKQEKESPLESKKSEEKRK